MTSRRTVVLYTPGLPPASVKASIQREFAARKVEADVLYIGDSRAIPKGLHVDVLAGFSAGCHRVRDQLEAGAEPSAVVLADGTHYRDAQTGGTPMPLQPWVTVFDRAMRGEGPALYVSHTYLVYTDQMKDDPRTTVVERAFFSTATTLRKLTGWALNEPKDPRGTATRAQGKLVVTSHESGDADKQAHIRQETEHLPRMIAYAVAQLEVERPAPAPAAPAEETPSAPAWRDPSFTRRQRLLAWAGAEMISGVRETSENDGPRIRDYREGTTYLRRDTKSGKETILPIGPAPWCAMAVCYGLEEVTLPGEASALPANRVSGVELVRDAEESGALRDPKERARPGDIAVWKREGSGSGWERHVTIVVQDDGTPEGMVTVGGNEANAWSPLEGVKHKERPLAVIAVE